MNRRTVPWLLGLLALAPAARAAETGTVTGVIDRPNEVRDLVAVDRSDSNRDNLQKGYKGRVDTNTGRFTVSGLPVDKVYDLIIETGSETAPVRLEGVNLSVRRSDFEEEQPLAEADRKKLDKIVRSLNKFEDQVEVMAITAHVQHAPILLNKLGTRPFYMSKPGEVIWRLELWHFEKPEEIWVKDQEDLFLTMYRQRLQKSDFEKKILALDPALGGVRLTAKDPAADVGKV